MYIKCSPIDFRKTLEIPDWAIYLFKYLIIPFRRDFYTLLSLLYEKPISFSILSMLTFC